MNICPPFSPRHPLRPNTHTHTHTHTHTNTHTPLIKRHSNHDVNHCLPTWSCSGQRGVTSTRSVECGQPYAEWSMRHEVLDRHPCPDIVHVFVFTCCVTHRTDIMQFPVIISRGDLARESRSVRPPSRSESEAVVQFNSSVYWLPCRPKEGPAVG